jgi:hypothetical protein
MVREEEFMIEKEQWKINKGILTGWTVISLVLLAAYFVETIKGSRTQTYFLGFTALDLIPLIFGYVLYRRNKARENIKIISAVGYTVLYSFALFTSNGCNYIVYGICIYFNSNIGRTV